MMKTCKTCDIKFNGSNCPVCGRKIFDNNFSLGQIVLIPILIIVGVLILAFGGGLLSLIIFSIFFKFIKENKKILLANISLGIGMLMNIKFLKLSAKHNYHFINDCFISNGISSNYENKFDGFIIIMSAIVGFYSIRKMYRLALKNNDGLLSNLLVMYHTKSYRNSINEADKIEVQKAIEQIKVSSKELNKLTEKLKPLVKEKERVIQQLKKDGIEVNMGSSIEEIMNKTREKHKDILNKYSIK